MAFCTNTTRRVCVAWPTHIGAPELLNGTEELHVPTIGGTLIQKYPTGSDLPVALYT